jgi:hypothetical protein
MGPENGVLLSLKQATVFSSKEKASKRKIMDMHLLSIETLRLSLRGLSLWLYPGIEYC